MCGIVGFLDKTGNARSPVGQTILRMLAALGCRGPDSAGVALYGAPSDGALIARVKLGDRGTLEEKARRVAERVRERGALLEQSSTAEYVRLVLKPRDDAAELARFIESIEDGLEVISLGRRLEIVKQVGSPQKLEATFGVSRIAGTHGIGHTRLSTESRVDLSHSQPFWAHGVPDLANGHITNYHKLRRRYEQKGVRFYTENDSEIIGIYLGERLAQGMSLEQALHASMVDFDGSFSYLAATSDALGYAKDPFAFKPLLVAETDGFAVVATEEVAIHAAFPGPLAAREAQAREVRVWRR
jgi:glutamate synthase domain-containing protein 1